MTDKFDPVFATSGSVDSETEYNIYVNNGLVDERVRYKCFNKLHQLPQQKINSLLDGELRGFDGSDLNHITQLYPSSVASTFIEDSQNVLRADTPGENYAKDMCFYIDSSGVKHWVALETQGRTVDDFNLSTGVRTQHDLSSGLPTPSAGFWYPCSVCTDNEYLYVLFSDQATAGGASSDRYVQSYDLDTFSVNTSWPAEGRNVGGTNKGTGITGGILVCTTGKLAVNCCWDYANNQGIRIMDSSDGSVLTTGDGDNPAVTVDYARNTFTSDGNYIYFAVRDTSTTYDHFCSVDITNASVGCGGTGFPKQSEVAGDVVLQVIAGNGIVVYVFDNYNRYWVASPNNADHGYLSITSDYGDVIIGLGFDGVSFWALAKNAASSIPYVVELPNLEAQMDGTDYSYTAPREWAISANASNLGATTRLIFDGADFYYAGNNGLSNSGIFRFPKALVKR